MLGRNKLLYSLSALCALPLLLTGCLTFQDPEAQQLQAAEDVAVLAPGETVGQTLTSRRSRLNGIDLWLGLTPEAAQVDGNVLIRLTNSPFAAESLFEGYFGYAQIAAGSPMRIAIPVQDDPPGQSYFLSISSDQGGVRLMGSRSDVYPHGQALLNGKPGMADLAFQLSYQYDATALFADLRAALSQSYLMIPLLLILILPGALLLSWLRAPREFSLFVALAAGLSLSSLPILLTWTTITGLPWARLSAWLAAALLTLALLWQAIHWLNDKISRGRIQETVAWRLTPQKIWDALAVSILFILALITRLTMTRDLAAPPWVDSVHHGLITSLILDQGSLPASYAPFLDIATASYHAGFHALLAFFTWLSALDLPAAMLLFGQVLNALSVYAVYLFTRVAVKDRWAAVIAAGIAAFFTPMPAYFTSWGRYTQLTGLLILPSALYFIQRLLDAPLSSARERRKNILLAGLAGAGLFLAHYRVAAFLAAYMAADLVTRGTFRLFNLSGNAPDRSATLVRQARCIGLAAATGLFFTLPWLPSALTSFFIPKLTAWQATRAVWFGDFAWFYLTTAWGKPALALAGLGMALAALRRQRFAVTLVLWVALMFLMANLGALGLPGAGFLNNTSVEISLFFPTAALAGYALGETHRLLSKALPLQARRAHTAAWAAAIAVVMLLAARQIVSILNPVTFLYRQDDRAALAWIAENIPPGETVLINPFPWGYGLYAGNDGGYWIAPLAGRQTLPPPVLYGFGDDPAKMETINWLSREASENAGDPKAIFSLMQAQKLRYIYIGRRGGVFSPSTFAASANFEAVYQQYGVWIFKTRENAQP
jgi:hypothetical protein